MGLIFQVINTNLAPRYKSQQATNRFKQSHMVLYITQWTLVVTTPMLDMEGLISLGNSTQHILAHLKGLTHVTQFKLPLLLFIHEHPTVI